MYHLITLFATLRVRKNKYTISMRKFLPIFLCLLCAGAYAQKVGQVTAETTRMSPQTLKRLFLLKEGDDFSQKKYERAQDELHRLRVFKKLDFAATAQGDTTDIHITAQDGSYIFPFGFISKGKKSAAGLALAGGNLFKQGESVFAFVGGGDDGFSSRLGASMGKHFVSVAQTHLNFYQRFYRDNWQNSYGVFSTTDDEEEYQSRLLAQLHGREDEVTLLYAYRLSRTLSARLEPQYRYVSYADGNLDNGNHSTLSFALRYADDVRPNMNMGALSGYGLSDKAQSLQDLPRARSGYLAEISYTAGGTTTGSDYEIQKLGAQAAWILELKSRHTFMVQLKAQDAIKAPFSSQITSLELLSGAGRYDRTRRGSRGIGAGVSFAYYLLRNQAGLLSLAPFYELAYVYDTNTYRPHSGVGATLSYKLWRFPLPFGVNYTHNLQDGSHQVGFVLGGTF